MGKSVFNKKISKSCLYCFHGRKSEFSNDIFCKKRGVTNRLDACRHYKYDALKRTPSRIKPNDNYNPEDFNL